MEEKSKRESFSTVDNAYRKRVSFDNANDTQAIHSYTLNHASYNFITNTRSRTFMVALDLDEGFVDPIKFTLEDLVDDGDEIVVVGSSEEKTDKDHPKFQAEKVMQWIKSINVRKTMISIIIELSYSSPDHALDQMIEMYQPSAVIVGAKNKQKYKSHYAGTGIFKYRLQHTKTPIIIVKDQSFTKSSTPTEEVKDFTKRVKRSLRFF